MAWTDAARAAAAAARAARARGDPWRREPMRVNVVAADKTLVAANAKQEVKRLKVLARTDEEAKKKAEAFYRKREYKNIKVTSVEHLPRTAENLHRKAAAAAVQQTGTVHGGKK